MSAPPRPALSVVVPVYNEAGNVAPLFTEIHTVMSTLGRAFEIIFVNDGSTDGTLEQLRQLGAREPCLRVIELDGNFGEAAALCAGFSAARGDLIITLDGDGQNDPHDIPPLLEVLERNDYRVVSGWRQDRQEGRLLRIWPSRVANRLIAAITKIPTHDNGCGLKVYQRAVVTNAALPRGMNRFMPAIFGVAAAEVAEVPVHDRRRQQGQSHYGFSRTLVVLRDLLAVRFMIGDPQRAEAVWAVATLGAAALHVYGHAHHSAPMTAVSGAVAIVAAMIWWNLRRYNRAQRHGVFRVRREYTASQAGLQEKAS